MEPGSILTAGAQALARAMLAALLFAAAARSSPPESPIKCDSGNSNCTITNSYGAYPDRSTCRFARAVFPATEAELVAAVAAAVREGRKMKAATRYSHSIPKLSCPGGDEGVVISTRELNHIVGVNSSAMEMTVESGVVLRDLIKAAAGSGLALLHAPYWAGVTVGGILGTGAHGSSLWGKGSAVHDYVVGARIVAPASPAEGYAVVRSLDAGDPDLDAVKVSLGVLGIISQVTLKLQPLFKRSITYVKRSDAGLAAAAVTFGSQYEFADIKWFPGSRQAFFRQDSRASSNALGNGLYDYIGFRRTITAGLALERTTEETLEAVGDAGGKCTVAKQINGALSVAAYGLTNDGVLFTGYPVVGSQHRMQASGGCLKEADDGLLTACAWDPRVKGKFYHQTTFTVALPKVSDFIANVHKLRELQPNGLCTVELYDGILLRYVRASTAFLGKEEDGIDFDVTYYRSRDPLTPRLYEDVLEEIEQMAVFKYGALPHWGKNRNAAFAGVNAKYAKMGEFLAVKGRYDPQGFFSSEWTDQILGIAGSPKIERDGCALEGLCVCSDDRHCAPAKGYLCRPGKVYKEARVCTRVNK